MSGIGDNVNIGVSATTEGAVGPIGALRDEVVVLNDEVIILDKNIKILGSSLKALQVPTDSAVSANDKLAVSADASVAALDRESVAMREAGASSELYAANLKRVEAARFDAAMAQKASVANLGSTYTNLTRLESLGTPALLKAATWTILGVGGVAYEGIKQYLNFNKLITQSITQAGVPASQMGFLSKTAESISQMSGVSLSDVANSIYRVASGTASWNNGLGATKKQLVDITTQVTKLQVLGNVQGGATSEQSARVITALINANMSDIGSSPKKAVALANAVIGASDMRLSDLVPAIGRGLLSSAKANNVSAKDALAWTGLLTSLGVTGGVAGNYVKTGINLLANPSAQGTLALAMLGIKPGEMQGIMAGKGGLAEAVAVLKSGMMRFNPAASFVGYRDKLGNPRAGGTGMPAAINKAETWAVGELTALHPDLLKRWIHGGSAKSGGLTASEASYVNDLILTKAFGGSKQFATIAALTNNYPRLLGMIDTINRRDNQATVNNAERMALSTPAQRFAQDRQKVMVALVEAGKALYPSVIHLTDGLTWLIEHILSWKPALYEIGAAMGAIVLAAGVVKAASLGKGLMAIAGGALTHFNSKGTQGQFLRNIYAQQSGDPVAKLGAASQAFSEKQVAATIEEGNKVTAASETAATRIISASDLNASRIIEATMAANGLSSRSSVGSLQQKVRGAEQQAIQNESQMAARIDRMPGTGKFFNTNNMPILAHGRDGKLFNVNQALIARDHPSALAENALRDQYNLDKAAHAEAALNGVSGNIPAGNGAARYASIVEHGGLGNLPNPPMPILGAANGVAPIVESQAGLMSRIGGSAMDMAGGPLGMAMMVASIMPLAIPMISRALGGLNSWLGGHQTAPPAFVSVGNINTLSNNEKIAANLRARIKALHYDPLGSTSKTHAKYVALVNDLAAVTGSGKTLGKHPYAALIGAYNTYNDPGLQKALRLTGKKGFLGQGGGIGPNGFAITDSTAAARSDLSLLNMLHGPEKTAIAAMLHDTLNQPKGGKYNYLSGMTPARFQKNIRNALVQYQSKAAAVLNSTDGRLALAGGHVIAHYNDIQAARGSVKNGDFWNNAEKLLSKTHITSANYGVSMARSHEAAQIAAEYLKKSKDTSLGAKADSIYANASKEADKVSKEFQAVATEIITKEHQVRFSPQSVSDLRTAVGEAMDNSMVKNGLTSDKMARAYMDALRSSGGFLAGIVSGANSRTHGTGGPKSNA